ncbi:MULTISPECIES: hypothetical protein [Salipaludibacillus]|uniref:hypothetical protein n=1 Tax=Salipaludibacillus TaxID=1884449 RepID=UPI0016003937|nr:hypothetical protein [Salipaludibacillus neizhouensis]
MRSGYSHQNKALTANRLIHTDLHRFVEADDIHSAYEMATEFGPSNRGVRSLKKRLERN